VQTLKAKTISRSGDSETEITTTYYTIFKEDFITLNGGKTTGTKTLPTSAISSQTLVAAGASKPGAVPSTAVTGSVGSSSNKMPTLSTVVTSAATAKTSPPQQVPASGKMEQQVAYEFSLTLESKKEVLAKCSSLFASSTANYTVVSPRCALHLDRFLRSKLKPRGLPPINASRQEYLLR
jgi:hypothetical protein